MGKCGICGPVERPGAGPGGDQRGLQGHGVGEVGTIVRVSRTAGRLTSSPGSGEEGAVAGGERLNVNGRVPVRLCFAGSNPSGAIWAVRIPASCRAGWRTAATSAPAVAGSSADPAASTGRARCWRVLAREECAVKGRSRRRRSAAASRGTGLWPQPVTHGRSETWRGVISSAARIPGGRRDSATSGATGDGAGGVEVGRPWWGSRVYSNSAGQPGCQGFPPKSLRGPGSRRAAALLPKAGEQDPAAAVPAGPARELRRRATAAAGGA